MSVLLEDLNALNASDAWRGAAAVWTHAENLIQHRGKCLAGIKAGLNANTPHRFAVAQAMSNMFGSTTPLISVPIELIQCCFSAFESKSESEPLGIIGFGEWLNATAHRNPEQALPATELYLAHFSQTKTSLYDYENNLMQLLTRLFAEAEEREESDQGEMLRRVVAVQDSMLTLGLNGLDKWLGAAERP